MDKSELEFHTTDFSLLRTPCNVQTTKKAAPPKAHSPPPPNTHKSELQELRLSDASHKRIMEALSEIYGHEFKLDDISKYTDHGGKHKNLFWRDSGGLKVRGMKDFSANANGSTGSKANDNGVDRFHMFAMLMLENYGFDPGHCKEAFEYCNSDVSAALVLLYKKYMRISDELELDSTEIPDMEEILKIRNEEKIVLDSIYGDVFEEKEANRVWSLKFKADHLLAYSPAQMRRAEEQQLKAAAEATGKKKPPKDSAKLCRNYQKSGTCKFGDKCRFLHKRPEVDLAELDCNDNKSEFWFFVEIRFPPNSRYPFEPPHIYLKTNCHDLPNDIRLRISRNMYRAAIESCKSGFGCVYAACDLVQTEECLKYEITDPPFPSPHHSIFYEESTDEECAFGPGAIGPPLPTHYTRGQIARSENSMKSDAAKIEKENRRISKLLQDKENNSKYQKMIAARCHLPAYEKMDDIMRSIEESQIVIISGETGCGKSTQVPQFILEHWHKTVKNLADTAVVPQIEIVCTQPRRLSAISLAERVAAELADRVGNIVGYQIGLENKISASTRLTFCTTGILLRRLSSDPLLKSATHVLIDEVHERSDEIDFVLLILKRLIKQRKDLKVVLMSATVNAKLFSDYFDSAPILTIPGRTFPVEEYFLEDILERCDYVLESDSSLYGRKIKKSEEAEFLNDLELANVLSDKVAPPDRMKDQQLNLSATLARYSNCTEVTCKTIHRMDPMMINIDLIESVVKYIVAGDHDWPRQGSILIFLPGLIDIQMVLDAFKHLGSDFARNLIFVPLHSTLMTEEQNLLFRPVPKDKRRIVLSTNIAETSITIDDCVFVIDCGLMKEKRFDPNRNMESLELVWVSRASAQQRKGRAGRVMPGICIRLYTSNRYYQQFESQSVPEMQRIPLDQLVLRIKSMETFTDLSPQDVLNKTLEPPNQENVLNALVRLKNVGALDEDDQLTPLGLHLSELPVDIRIGKLMLYGAIFQCLDSVLTIAASLSHKTPFLTPFNERHKADRCKRQFAVCNSDHLTILMAYNKWLVQTKLSYHAGRNYAQDHYLSLKTLETIGDLKYQYLELLVSIGFVPIDVPRRNKKASDNIRNLTGDELNVNGDNFKLLVSLLCAALYPNVIMVMTPERTYVETVGGVLPKPYTARDLRFKTRDDGYVKIHPSSINSCENNFVTPFLLYQEKVKTSSLYVRDCSMLSLVALVLFAGSDFRVELQHGEFLFLVDANWIKLKADNYKTAEVIHKLRQELFVLLEEKIKDPCLSLMNDKKSRKLIETIVYIITYND